MNPKTGLYSKAAQIIRSLPQERGTAEQMIAAAKKAGVKDAELEHAGPITGKIDRETLAQAFEARLPKVTVDQYGENPRYLTRAEDKVRAEYEKRINNGEELSPEERTQHDRLRKRRLYSPNVLMQGGQEDGDGSEDEEPMDTQYGSYRSEGAKNYRERLLKLPEKQYNPSAEMARRVASARETLGRHEEVYGADHPITQQTRETLGRQEADLEKAKRIHGEPREYGSYQSSHWDAHPNVLAHIRLSDRTVGEDRESVRPIAEKLAANMGVGVRDLSSGSADMGVKQGLITPEEAASLSRVMRWRNGYEEKKGVGKRLLHVEELQSDWAQEGRDKGFRNPDKPYRVWDKSTGKTVSEHETHDQAWDTYRTHPDSDKLDYGHNNAPPPAPYVTNTQHWTDLALKNVLQEAALGNYDGVVFANGQNQADRYGLEKQLDRLQYMPNQKRVVGYKDGKQAVMKEGVEPNDLQGMVGKDLTERLLHPDNTFEPSEGNRFHELRGDDLKMGGQGMKGYYDNIVPKSVMKLAQQHDPAIKPAEPVSYDENNQPYQGFHLPMTDTLKNSILDKGFPAFKRGGKVDAALAVTRRFTKDGAGAMMRLKP